MTCLLMVPYLEGSLNLKRLHIPQIGNKKRERKKRSAQCGFSLIRVYFYVFLNPLDSFTS